MNIIMNKIVLVTVFILFILLIVKRDTFQTVYDQKIVVKDNVYSKNIFVNKKLKSSKMCLDNVCLDETKLNFVKKLPLSYEKKLCLKNTCLDSNNANKIPEIKIQQDRTIKLRDMKLIISLENRFNKYLSAQPNGTVNWDRVKANSWEKIELIKNTDGTVSFKGVFSRYLSNDPNQNSFTWNKSSIGLNEKFKLERVDKFYTIQNRVGKYLKINSDNSMNWINEIDELCKLKLSNNSYKFNRITNLINDFEYLQRTTIELEEKLNRERRERENARLRAERQRERRRRYPWLGI